MNAKNPANYKDWIFKHLGQQSERKWNTEQPSCYIHDKNLRQLTVIVFCKAKAETLQISILNLQDFYFRLIFPCILVIRLIGLYFLKTSTYNLIFSFQALKKAPGQEQNEAVKMHHDSKYSKNREDSAWKIKGKGIKCSCKTGETT